MSKDESSDTYWSGTVPNIDTSRIVPTAGGEPNRYVYEMTPPSPGILFTSDPGAMKLHFGGGPGGAVMTIDPQEKIEFPKGNIDQAAEVFADTVQRIWPPATNLTQENIELQQRVRQLEVLLGKLATDAVAQELFWETMKNAGGGAIAEIQFSQTDARTGALAAKLIGDMILRAMAENKVPYQK